MTGGFGVEFRVLGALEISADRSTIGAAKLRNLLGALLVSANQKVVADRLVEAVWGQQAPDEPRRALNTYAARLRRVLREAGCTADVQWLNDGYLIVLDEASFDLGVFEATVQQADAARVHEPDREAELLRAALALWRGDPLADVPSEHLQRTVVPALIDRRLQVLERRIELDLGLGRHAELVAELTWLTDRYPFREGLWALLMTALTRCGRRADALRAFRTAREHLSGELGIEPSTELNALHRTILNGDSTDTARSADVAWLGQCRLPTDPGELVGRDEVVAELIELLRPEPGGTGVPVAAVTGPPGVGKSAVAIHTAHRLRGAYPDGQWFVRLDGAGTDPRQVVDLLDELLRTAGVPTGSIPAREEQRAGLLRARLADRRILLVLDDAANAAQVVPLLPGTATCAVLVTSRNELTGLAVTHGAVRRPLDVLSPGTATGLLSHVLGADRVAAEPAAAAELAELCGRLPLALHIAAANLADRREDTIADYVRTRDIGDVAPLWLQDCRIR